MMIVYKGIVEMVSVGWLCCGCGCWDCRVEVDDCVFVDDEVVGRSEMV